MFYDIKKDELFYSNIYEEPVSLQDDEGNEIQGFNTHFLDKLDDETLKKLGFARVEQIINENLNIDEYHILEEVKNYDESLNIYTITQALALKSLDECKELKKRCH